MMPKSWLGCLESARRKPIFKLTCVEQHWCLVSHGGEAGGSARRYLIHLDLSHTRSKGSGESGRGACGPRVKVVEGGTGQMSQSIISSHPFD